jgi:hypothetical protein
MLLADGQPQVIHIEWQALAAFGSILGGFIVTAAKILANQAQKYAEAMERRHVENRQDAVEARAENRQLSAAIMDIQARSVQTLVELQGEIRHLSDRVGAPDHGSKEHATHPARPRGRQGGDGG